MQNIKRFVEHVKMDHEERLQDIRIQMKSLPPGDLIFARKNQKYYCVQKLNDQRFGITRDQQLVQGLALKRYLQEERDALQDNLKILDKVLKDCQNTSFDDIMQRSHRDSGSCLVNITASKRKRRSTVRILITRSI